MTAGAVRDEPVGVLGGLGPAATVLFMRRLVELTDAPRDQDHVDLLVWQHGSIPDRSAFLLGHGESPEPVLVADAVALERAGARFIAIPCNTAVVWVEQMRAAVSIEVLDTVAETVDAARRAVPGLQRLGRARHRRNPARRHVRRCRGRRRHRPHHACTRGAA